LKTYNGSALTYEVILGI